MQPGNAPLTSAVVSGNVVNYAGGDLDRFDLIWETVAGAGGTQDRFSIQYRATGSNGPWLSGSNSTSVDTGTGGRIIHTSSVTGLNWNTNYDYRVFHRQGDVVIGQYQATYKTRLAQGDQTSFSFAAYGDSADGATATGYRQVQVRCINAVNPSFSVLLGDNVYDNGTHVQSDSRFDPVVNPEAAARMSTRYIGLSRVGKPLIMTGTARMRCQRRNSILFPFK